MKQKYFNRNVAHVLGLLAFIATGGGLIVSTALHEKSFYKTEIMIIYGCFFVVSLIDHYQTIRKREGSNDNKKI